MIETSLPAVFLVGLLGGVHCAGMCGGIVAALAMQTRRTQGGRDESATLYRASRVGFSGASLAASAPVRARSVGAILIQGQLFYNLGRISTYTVLGALAGSAGSLTWLLQTALPVQQIALAMSSGLLLLMGLYVAGWQTIARPLERIGRPVWARIRPHATRRLASTGQTSTVDHASANAHANANANAFLLGSLWGLVPCGMIYGVLMAALFSGGPVPGALLMLSFGLGTLPNLLALGLAGNTLARLSRDRRVRRVAGALIASLALPGLLRLDLQQSIPYLDELCTFLTLGA